MHIIQEVLSPGKYKYKVYTAKGALVFIGESASTAQSIYKQGKELEAAKNAKLRRNDVSSGSSDSDSV
jgi:hypothetical protein